MRSYAMIAVIVPVFLLAACGSDRERTVVVNPPSQASPPQSNTVVVPPSGPTKVCPAGYTTC